ncbi:MAG: nucleotide-diphospho-sugar transferase [Bacteroidetes bacterium]|nr:nucleotide-diphospho-sugar transferase [Bacteroidota bacterium]
MTATTQDTNQSSDKVSVLLLAFNRPVITEKVLEAIAIYAPRDLYIGIDGPRPGNEKDVENCGLVKKLVDNWEQKNPSVRVHKLYRDKNLGCGHAVSEAINWFFDNEEMGIILEDDCLPNKSFFSFCQILLRKYYDNEAIMHIGGSNYLDDKIKIDSTYYFSKFPHIWGWATWRRAWKKYQFDMPHFDEFLHHPDFKRYYDNEVFIKVKQKEVDTWDSQWVYTFIMNEGLSILPKKNLVKNLGFDEFKGTHLHKKPKWYNDNTTEIQTIIHPNKILQNQLADDYIYKKAYKKTIIIRIKTLIKKLFFKKV